jgi:hypothetical protein
MTATTFTSIKDVRNWVDTATANWDDRTEEQTEHLTRYILTHTTYGRDATAFLESLPENLADLLPEPDEIDPTKREYQNRGCNFGIIWDACQSTVFRVLTETGEHTGHALTRHLHGRHWLYVDDDSGYSVEEEEAVIRWNLQPE